MRPDARRDHRRWLVAATVAALAWGAVAFVVDTRLVWLDLLLHLGPTVLGVGALAALAGWRPAGAAAFLVDEDAPAFIVPTNRRRTVETAALVFVVVSLVILVVDWIGTGDPAPLDIALSVLLLAAAGGLLLRTWLVPARLELLPDGVRVPDTFRTRMVRWEAMRPGTPWAPQMRTQRLELHARRRIHKVPIDVLDIHPWFLADAIRYYVAHPEHRAAIGRAAEHERLRKRLRDGGAPPALPAARIPRQLPAGSHRQDAHDHDHATRRG
jgi:hypothetical protein